MRHLHSWTLRWGFGFGCGILAASVGAQPTPLGAEFQANSYTSSAQRAPSVAAAFGGSFVVAWESYGSSGTDNSGFSIQAQRYQADGTPLGAQFQVNTYTTSDQLQPSVASDAVGNFVVVWQSAGSSGSDTSAGSIQGQRYRADGTPLGAQFQVNSYTTSFQYRPGVAADAAGNFVVVWESYGSSGTDSSFYSIQGQRFRADGTPLGAQFQVNSYTTLDQRSPDIASDALGKFVVVWESDGSNGTDGSNSSIHGQLFGPGGAPIGGEFQVNSYTTNYQRRPAVASDAKGDLVVVWQSYGSIGTDSSQYAIVGQRFAANGGALGAEFQVNAYTTSNQKSPRIASDPAGNFVVVWESTGSQGTDVSGQSIQGQRYRADGTPLGAQFQSNTYTTGNQFAPGIASDSAGRFEVVWASQGSGGTDASDLAVLGQRYGLPTLVVTSSSYLTGGPDCVLRDAITAATTDTATGGCAAGNGGGVVDLQFADPAVMLRIADNGANGLPVVTTPLQLLAHGKTIGRLPTCPGPNEFRLFHVDAGGLLRLEDVTLSGGCLLADAGAAIFDAGVTVLDHATVTGNQTGTGGGLYVSGALFGFDSSITANVASSQGGGIAATGMVWLSRDALSGNSATSGGGAVLLGSLRMRDVTVAGNSGGGLLAESDSALGFVTIVGNSGNAGLDVEGATATVTNSLVGGNPGGDCAGGPLTATDHNLDTDGTCTAIAGGAGFATVASFGLSPVGFYGGPSASYLPFPGSPAIDAATSCVTPAVGFLHTDQRGFARPSDGNFDGTAKCDLGADELGGIFADGFESGDSSRWSLTVP